MFRLYGQIDFGQLDLLCELPCVKDTHNFAVDYALSPDHDVLYLVSLDLDIVMKWDLSEMVEPNTSPWRDVSPVGRAQLGLDKF